MHVYLARNTSSVCSLHLLFIILSSVSLVKGALSKPLFRADGETFAEEMQSNDQLQGTEPLEFVREYDAGNDSRGIYALTDQQRGECTVHDVYHILLPLPVDPIVRPSVLFPVIIWSALLTCHPSVHSPIDVSIKSMRYHFLISRPTLIIEITTTAFLQTFHIIFSNTPSGKQSDRQIFSIVSQCVTKPDNSTRRSVHKCSHDKTPSLTARKLPDKLT